MKLFDTHTHLNAEQFQGIEDEVVAAARANEVAYLAVVGFDEVTIHRALALSERYDDIICAVGWHPTEAYRYTAQVERHLEDWLSHSSVHMLGEIGLDYHWDDSTPQEQDRVFRRQLAIAKEHNLPITIHNREATEAVYQVLKEEGLPEAGGIMHSFGEGPEWAQRFLDLGMYLSFSGVATFKKTDDVRAAAKLTPADRILIETDAPYLAPVPMRGKRNEPAFVRYVAEVLAEVRGVSLEEFAQQTTANACRLFRWQPEEASQ